MNYVSDDVLSSLFMLNFLCHWDLSKISRMPPDRIASFTVMLIEDKSIIKIIEMMTKMDKNGHTNFFRFQIES